MIRGLLLLVVGVWASPASAHSIEFMSLSDAWATPVWIQNAVLNEPAAETHALSTSEETVVQTAVAVGLDASQMRAAKDRYFSGLRLHRAGNIALVLGAVSVIPFAVLTVGAAFGRSEGLAVLGATGVVLGIAAFYTGGILSSVGAIQATNAVNAALGLNLSRTVGFGGVITTLIGIPTGFFGVGLIGPVVGVIAGVVQLQLPKRALEEAGLVDVEFVPTGRGFAVTGRF